MDTNQIIDLARKHLAGTPKNEGSARLCLMDAASLTLSGRLKPGRERALKSLAYSVGIFHPDYVRAAK